MENIGLVWENLPICHLSCLGLKGLMWDSTESIRSDDSLHNVFMFNSTCEQLWQNTLAKK